MHCKTSGVSDYFAQGIYRGYFLLHTSECIENVITNDINLVSICNFVHVLFLVDELHALALGRNIIKNLHMAGKDVLANGLQNINYEYKEPLYDINELRSIAPTDLKQQFDIRSVIDRIVDGSEFDEFKKLYGTVRTYPLYFFICLTIILISMGCYGMIFFLSAPVHLMICHTLIGC